MRATAKRKFLESGFRDVKDSSLSVISPLTFVFSFKHQTIFENSSEYGIPVKRAQHVWKDILAARQLDYWCTELESRNRIKEIENPR